MKDLKEKPVGEEDHEVSEPVFVFVFLLAGCGEETEITRLYSLEEMGTMEPGDIEDAIREVRSEKCKS